MKNSFKVLFLGAFLSFSCALFAQESATLTDSDPIKIGVSVALTGAAATYGEDMRNALIFANRYYAKNRYHLVFEDDACTGKGAVTVANKLISVDKVKHVIGFVCSSTILSASKVYSQAGVLQITSCASAESIKNLGDLVYRVAPNDAHAAQKLHEVLAKKHKKIAILSEEADYPQEFVQSLEGFNSPKKYEIVKENYLPGTSDFRATLGKIKNNSEIEALIINSSTEAGSIDIVRQLRELNLQQEIYGIYWPSTKPFLEKTGSLANGIIFVDVPSLDELPSPEAKTVYAEFVKEFGEAKGISLFVLTAIESFKTLHESIESKQENQSFLNTQEFSGIFGNWKFDSFGESNNIPFVVRKIENQKPVLIQ